MKKVKKQNTINNQEDEDSSTYPLYPETNDIYNKEKKVGELGMDNNVKIIDPSSKLNDWHDMEFNPDSKKHILDVPGAELDDEDEKIGEEDEENNYYSIGGDNHNNLEEDKGD
jgi:hypothetical protein